MNPSEKDSISLDEKIALIRKKNEMIIKRKQLIEEEIELAKKHNAMVDVSAPKSFEDDKPTLYSDTIPKSHKEERKRSISNKVNYKPRSSNTREDAAWRAERNEIDKERIRRQRADSGWRREWDADKNDVPDDVLRDSFDRRSHSKEKSHTRSSHNQKVSMEQSELPVSTRQNQYKGKQSDVTLERSEFPVLTRQIQYKNQQSDVTVERSELPVSTRQSHKSQPGTVLVERSELPAPRQKPSRGRGRPVVSVDNPKITQSLRRTINVEPPNVKQEKTPLRKRVSWGSENELIPLKGDDLKNIKVKVNTDDGNSKKRSIEITEERGPLIKSVSTFKFDENTSFHIKDCVAKASSEKPRMNLPIKDAAPPSKPKDFSSTKSALKPIITNCNIKREPAAVSHASIAELPSKDEGGTGDEEWEDLSGEEWESASAEE